MKHFFPIALNPKFKTIVNKLADFADKNPVPHKHLIKKHGLNEKIYFNTYSKLMNK